MGQTAAVAAVAVGTAAVMALALGAVGLWVMATRQRGDVSRVVVTPFRPRVWVTPPPVDVNLQLPRKRGPRWWRWR